MTLEHLIDLLGEQGTITLMGLLIGLAFGALAQRSRFCMRAAVIETAQGHMGQKLAIWLVAFAVAITATQLFIVSDQLAVGEARQLAATGSLSGAIIGGAMFGVGMILARGCASRLLVLSATGNLRALVTGLILTIVAQASLRGGISPLREWLASLWTVSGGGDRNLIAVLGLGDAAPLGIGVILAAAGVALAVRNRIGPWVAAGTAGVGAMVALGWYATYTVASQSFDLTAVKSISFIGPSADTLMGFINEPTLPMVFDLGLVPGVFAGSFFAALLGRELKLQCFSIEESPMPRYVAGAVLMGFGGMLAGGCAVGAAVTGGSIFSLTAWVALAAMWTGGIVAYRLMDHRRQAAPEADLAPKQAAPAE